MSTAMNSYAATVDYVSMEKSYIDEYNKCLELDAELVKKKDMVKKEDAPAFLEFFEINKLKAQLQAKNTTISNLKKHIENLKGKSVTDCTKPVNNSNVITPGMFKLDLQPLSPNLRNNKEAHVYYIKVTTKHVDTLQGIVEQARALKPLDNALYFAQRSQLTNFVNKFMGIVRFGNDQVAAIMGYEGVDLLKGLQGINLYIISLEDMLQSSPICLLSKASKTKSWLWHRRLSHLNFDTLNQLTKQGLVKGLPKLKYEKDHLCSACSLGKSMKYSHKPKAENSNQEKLYRLHMDLCRPMRIESIHEKKYIIVMVDDYSRFTWVKFLRSKDETPEFVIKFLKKVQVALNATIRNIRTDNETEFVNQTIRSYYEDVRITHQILVTRTPQQNNVLERRNRILVEASRTIALCYPTNDNEDLGKLKPKDDIGLMPNLVSSTSYVSPSKKDWDILFQPMFDEYFNPSSSVVSPQLPAIVQIPADTTGTPSSTTIDQDTPSASTSPTTEEILSPIINQGVEEQQQGNPNA
ncbi:retrovirus-related pol polyprotein from transposon TNT 1-94 [Tanacetum coccineum]